MKGVPSPTASRETTAREGGSWPDYPIVSKPSGLGDLGGLGIGISNIWWGWFDLHAEPFPSFNQDSACKAYCLIPARPAVI